MFPLLFVLPAAAWLTAQINKLGTGVYSPATSTPIGGQVNMPGSAIFGTTSPDRGVVSVASTNWGGIIQLGLYLGFALVALSAVRSAMSFYRGA